MTENDLRALYASLNTAATVDIQPPRTLPTSICEGPVEPDGVAVTPPGTDAARGLRKTTQPGDRVGAEGAEADRTPSSRARRQSKRGLGAVLQKQRHALGITQRELARRLGVKPAHVGYLETDRRRPSLALLSKIATVLGLERERLFLLAHPEASALISARRPNPASGKDRAWDEFRQNRGLLAQHRVNARELNMLKRVNMLGKVSAPRNYLFILNAIRQALDEE